MTGLLASLPMTNHLPAARESAQRTYDRRRARSAADTLAQIPPNRWDDHTRQVIATLATISSPSRITDMLEAFDGPDGNTMIDIVSDDAVERVRAQRDREDPLSLPPGPRLFTWDIAATIRGYDGHTAESWRLARCRDVCGGDPLLRRDSEHAYPCPYEEMNR